MRSTLDWSCRALIGGVLVLLGSGCSSSVDSPRENASDDDSHVLPGDGDIDPADTDDHEADANPGPHTGLLTFAIADNGEKTTVAAVKNLGFIDAPVGAGWAAMGFDHAGADTGYTNASADFVHKAADPDFGGVCRIYAPTQPGGALEGVGEHFPHLSIDTFDSPDVQFSFWLKINLLSGATGADGSTFLQMKGTRAGVRPDDGPYDVVAQYAAAAPKFYPSWEGSVPAGTAFDANVSVAGPVAFASGEATGDKGRIQEGRWDINPLDGAWHNIRGYYSVGTPGNADGVLVFEYDGYTIHDLTNLTMLAAGSDARLGYLQPVPSFMANGMVGLEVEALLANVHVDTGRAAVFLGNAPSLSAVTKRVYGNPLQWTDAGPLSANGFEQIPAGEWWAYRTTAAGVTNAVGVSYTLE